MNALKNDKPKTVLNFVIFIYINLNMLLIVAFSEYLIIN